MSDEKITLDLKAQPLAKRVLFLVSAAHDGATEDAKPQADAQVVVDLATAAVIAGVIVGMDRADMIVLIKQLPLPVTAAIDRHPEVFGVLE